MAKRKKVDTSIQCWGPGGFWRNGECGETLPDGNHATMRRLGWGFTMDEEAAENYYACPEHKDEPRSLYDDFTPAQQEAPTKARSSTAEPSAHNGLVAGSTPAAPTTNKESDTCGS